LADDKSPNKKSLDPVEPSDLLRRLQLTTGKAAQFAGVSRRQLCYWTDTGIVSAVDDGTGEDGDDPSRRTYDFDGLHRVLLIKRAMKQFPGLRRAATEVEQHLAAKKRRAEDLASSIGQKREEFLTEQADKLEALAARLQEVLPRVQDRDRLLEISEGMEWLERMADRILGGGVLLEENAEACLRLANFIEQAEAKLDGLGQAE
jgi:DNA-binding transcriptional MerR regulator